MVRLKQPASPVGVDGRNCEILNHRIRVAYMSADFREHPMTSLVAELFELHDRDKFEIYAISLGPKIDSAIRTRLKKSFDHWHDVHGIRDQEVVDLIRNLGIDIIVDLMGHTAYSRPGILICRPASVQVNYLGYPATMGANFIDYILVDNFIAPAGHDEFYTEKLVRLPNSYMAHDSKRKIADESLTRADCGLPANGFVFYCFNKSNKITPMIFDVWMRLLKAIPGSVIWLAGTNIWTKDNLRKEAVRRDVAEERLIFAPRIPALSDHLARQRLADLFVDTPIYNAHTTAIDALWAGIPVLTCAGRSFAARVAGSLLQAVGLPELITTDLAEYEALALRLAREPGLLPGYSERLAGNIATKPLFDCQRFTRGVESAYSQMYERWRNNKAPEAFSIDEDQ